MQAIFAADPEDLGLTLVSGDQKSRNVVFERRFPSAFFTLRYYFSTGTVHLVYPVERHPTHADGQDTDRLEWDAEEDGWVSVQRRVQENYRGLDDAQFCRMLRNAPQWFGKGYLLA